MAQREVVVVSGVRTGIGDYGGSLKDVPTTRLGAIAIRTALERAGIDAATVGHVVLGGVIHGEARDMYLSRVAAIDAGLPVGTPCLNSLEGKERRIEINACPEIEGAGNGAEPAGDFDTDSPLVIENVVVLRRCEPER